MSETVSEDPTGAAEGTDQGADDSQEDQGTGQTDQTEGQTQARTTEDEIAYWKKMSRAHERAARSNSAAAAKLAEIEEGQKSDLQKAEEARQAAERDRDDARAQTNRMLAAAAHDLPTELIELLGDGTADEISERAEQISGIIKAEVDKRVEALLPPNGRGRQQTTPRQVAAMRPGAAPAGQSPGNPEQMFRQLINRDLD